LRRLYGMLWRCCKVVGGYIFLIKEQTLEIESVLR